MPKFDLDDTSIYSPIEFVIGGKTYTVKNPSKKLIDSIADKPLHEQFAVICGLEPAFVEENINFFQLREAMKLFFKTLMEPIVAEVKAMTKEKGKEGDESKEKEQKNVSGAGTKKSQK